MRFATSAAPHRRKTQKQRRGGICKPFTIRASKRGFFWHSLCQGYSAISRCPEFNSMKWSLLLASILVLAFCLQTKGQGLSTQGAPGAPVTPPGGTGGNPNPPPNMNPNPPPTPNPNGPSASNPNLNPPVHPDPNTPVVPAPNTPVVPSPNTHVVPAPNASVVPSPNTPVVPGPNVSVQPHAAAH
jgi:hypothetical protein